MISRGQFLARIGGAIAAVCSGATFAQELEAQESECGCPVGGPPEAGCPIHCPEEPRCPRCGDSGVVVVEWSEHRGAGIVLADSHLPAAPQYDLVEIPCPRCQSPRLERSHYSRSIKGTIEITEELLRKARTDPERFKRMLHHHTRTLERQFLEEASRY